MRLYNNRKHCDECGKNIDGKDRNRRPLWWMYYKSRIWCKVCYDRLKKKNAFISYAVSKSKGMADEVELIKEAGEMWEKANPRVEIINNKQPK